MSMVKDMAQRTKYAVLALCNYETFGLITHRFGQISVSFHIKHYLLYLLTMAKRTKYIVY